MRDRAKMETGLSKASRGVSEDRGTIDIEREVVFEGLWLQNRGRGGLSVGSLLEYEGDQNGDRALRQNF